MLWDIIKGLLIKLNNELELKDYSDQSTKLYIYNVKKYFEFSKLKRIDEDSMKKVYIKNT